MSGIVIVLLALSGAGAAPEDAIVLSVWAAQATTEGRETKYFDPELEPIRNDVNDLRFDTYHQVRVDRREAPCGMETRFPLDARYTLCVTPVSKEHDGRIRLDVRVEMAPRKEGDKPINALSTRMMAAPDKKTRFIGFKLEQGELVILLAVGS